MPSVVTAASNQPRWLVGFDLTDSTKRVAFFLIGLRMGKTVVSPLESTYEKWMHHYCWHAGLLYFALGHLPPGQCGALPWGLESGGLVVHLYVRACCGIAVIHTIVTVQT